MPQGLAPYLCDLHRSWLATDPARAHRQDEGSLLFLDISGFTPLTERLARHGKAGVEELIDTLNGVLAPLVGTASGLGGDTLKFGGDALLVLFTGPGHEERACAAAWDLQATMRSFRRVRTSAGTVALSASAGVASGPVDTFLAGDRFRELVVAGPVTSEVMALEKLAEAGEVLVAPATAAALEPGTTATGDRRLLRARPPAGPAPPPAADGCDPRLGLPAGLHSHLADAAESEHRQVTVAFAQFRGLDDLLAGAGPAAAAAELDALLARVQGACERHGVTFLATDADHAAGKVFLATGAPSASTDDEDRMLHALREIVAHDGVLPVRAGVNRGRAFAVHLGAPHRRTYTTMGDTTNLAARVMGKAPDGAVLATCAVLERVRTPFALTAVEPFTVKGKSAPVDAELVGAPASGRDGDVRRREETMPLTGREAELGVLRDALSSARHGAGRVVELVGEPGIGKSRLLAEAAEDAARAGMSTMIIEGGAYGTSAPYFALRAPLRRLVAAAHTDDAGVAEALAACVRRHQPATEPLLPLLAIPFGLDLPPTPETARLADEFRRSELHRLIDLLLAALLTSGRTLIVIEDAHWLDEASTDLLAAVLRQAPARGWAVLLSRRPYDTGLTGVPGSHTVALPPLEPEAARALVVSESAGTLPPHAVARLVERAAGNPLFLRELITAAVAGEDLDQLPETVEALLAARIDTLLPADRRLLRRAAVLGARFPISWLSGMLEQPVEQLEDGLARLGDFLWLDDERVSFSHALHQAAAYEALPYQRRRELHARAGEVIERELGADAMTKADILALHFLRADEPARAWPYARHAGDHACARLAYADAAELYRRALEAGRRLKLPNTDLADVWEALGNAYAHTGEPQPAVDAFSKARRLVAGDPLRQAQLLHRHARVVADAGHVRRTVRALLRGLRALDGVQGHDAATCRAHLTASLASARHREGRLPETIALCRQAIAEAERAGEERALADACRILDWALFRSGRGKEAVHSERALEICRRLGDVEREGTVLNNLGICAYWEGRWDDAVALYRAAGEAVARAGDLPGAAIADYNIGEVRSDQGRLEEAEVRLRRALETSRATANDFGIALVSAQLGRLAVRAGRADEGAAQLHEAHARFRELRVSHDALWVEALIAEACVFGGKAEPALTRSTALLNDLGGGGQLSPLLHRVRGYALAQLGWDEAAQAAFATSIERARSQGEPFEIVLSLDAQERLARESGPGDPRRRRECQRILERLDVVRLPQPRLGDRSAPSPAAIAAGDGLA